MIHLFEINVFQTRCIYVNNIDRSANKT